MSGCFSRNARTSVTLWGSTSMLKLAIISSPNLRGSSSRVVFVIMPFFCSLRYLLMMVSTLTCASFAMSLYFVRASLWRFRRMVMSILSIFCLAISHIIWIFFVLSCLLADYFESGFIWRFSGSGCFL